MTPEELHRQEQAKIEAHEAQLKANAMEATMDLVFWLLVAGGIYVVVELVRFVWRLM